jgi:flavin-dependent dehydrogenase
MPTSASSAPPAASQGAADASDTTHLNLPPSTLPTRCEVLVVGAGPAGSAAAQWLARAGVDVVLVDQQAFPRDKVCGDGLIPDAHHALRRLGVLDEVMAEACHASHVAAIGPRGGRIDVPGTLAVLPRRQLDLIVCRAAVAAGARMFAPVRFVEPLLEPGPQPDAEPPRVVGARLKAGGALHELRADWVLMASGAVPQALQSVALCRRRAPSAVALRGYWHNPAMAERIRALEVAWHPEMRTGYGWIFPCGKGLFNIGVGVEHSHGRRDDSDPDAATPPGMGQVNLREMLKTFGEVYPVAAELMSAGGWQGEVKGAPLRCSLLGAGFSRPGLLVTGEAAGSTFAFTGEGIGKALETGLLAAQALLEGRRLGWTDAALRAHYEQQLRALKPRYDVYDHASVVNRWPWLVELMVWSAKRSPARLRRMTGLLEETYLPRNPLSPGALMRLFFERG